jgi:hypothetical protein
MHAQDLPQPHPNSHRLRIDAVHCPAPTPRLHLDVTPQHHTHHRPQCAVPLSITQRALRSSHYASAYSTCAGGVQRAVGGTAPRQLPYPRTAPGWECVLPPNSSLTPTAFPSRLSRAGIRSTPPCNVAFASHTHNIASDGVLPRGSQVSPCVRRSTGTNCGERLWCAPCPVPHCLGPYLSFRARICYIDVRLTSFFSIP